VGQRANPVGVRPVYLRFVAVLSRDASIVPPVRHMLCQVLDAAGVAQDCIEEIHSAVAEAAANVMVHAYAADRFEVSAFVDDERCVLAVADTGRGFDSSALPGRGSDLNAEGGRGVEIMRALVDRITFDRLPRAGGLVRMEKRLRRRADAPLRQALGPGP